MSGQPYYLAYEKRYRKVFNAGAVRWGHSSDDAVLCSALAEWVASNDLAGKSVIEFACGEGGSGEILSKLGCRYRGVDISPSAVEKAKAALAPYPGASVSLLDMVNDIITEKYDAALDVMGFHMLVTDADREKYLKNAFGCLKNGASMLFFRETYRRDAPEGVITSIEQWKAITGEDYETLQKRMARGENGEVEVHIPLVPARARTREGYLGELCGAGFTVENFIEMDINEMCPYSASIYMRKPVLS